MKNGLGCPLTALLVAAVVGYLLYWAASASDCYGRGALVKNAWGGLSCVTTVKP